MSSSREANAPGVYSSPDDAPHAPSASASSTSCVMCPSSSAVAGRFSFPITMPRTVPSPTIEATFTAGDSVLSASHSLGSASKVCLSSPPACAAAAAPAPGARDDPSCPTTIVVTPCLTTDSARGSSHRLPSPCEWMSMNPGATAIPLASISTPPSASPRPIAAMRPSSIATSASIPGPPSPSKTVPPRMTIA